MAIEPISVELLGTVYTAVVSGTPAPRRPASTASLAVVSSVFCAGPKLVGKLKLPALPAVRD
jgi:hypothetical protein